MLLSAAFLSRMRMPSGLMSKVTWTSSQVRVQVPRGFLTSAFCPPAVAVAVKANATAAAVVVHRANMGFPSQTVIEGEPREGDHTRPAGEGQTEMSDHAWSACGARGTWECEAGGG